MSGASPLILFMLYCIPQWTRSVNAVITESISLPPLAESCEAIFLLHIADKMQISDVIVSGEMAAVNKEFPHLALTLSVSQD